MNTVAALEITRIDWKHGNRIRCIKRNGICQPCTRPVHRLPINSSRTHKFLFSLSNDTACQKFGGISIEDVFLKHRILVLSALGADRIFPFL